MIGNNGRGNEKTVLIIDVRTREEYVRRHIRGALNIPHYDLEWYLDLLKDKKIFVYCNTGRRATLAYGKLQSKKIDVTVIPPETLNQYEYVEKNMICAVNYLSVRPGHEVSFEELTRKLCQTVEDIDGFLGSKLFHIDGMSSVGSNLTGDCTSLTVTPTTYIILTYWETKEAHELSHRDPRFAEIYHELTKHLTKHPYEEFYRIIK